MLPVPFDPSRRVVIERDFIASGGPIPNRRNEGDGPIRRAGTIYHAGVHAGDMFTTDFDNAHAADRRYDMSTKKCAVCVVSQPLSLALNVRTHKFVRDLTEGPNCSFRVLGGDWIGTLLNAA
jgi:hypothetical protein